MRRWWRGRLLAKPITDTSRPKMEHFVMRAVNRRTTLLGIAASLTGQAPGWASEDDYPSREVKIIVSVPAGGGVDLSARIVANHLQVLWGKSFIVENRT